MNLLVSDYDGTLKTSVRKLNLNIEKIKEFQQAGNKFMISTGRSFTSLEKQINKYHIPYDYLSCNDGAVLFDKNCLVKDGTSYIPNDKIEEIIFKLSRLENCSNVVLYNEFGITNDKKDITEILINTNIFSSKKELNDLINSYGLSLYSFPGMAFIETPGGKGRTIEAVRISKEITDAYPEGIDVYSIGNGVNDIAMLKAYDGYKMLICHPKLYLEQLKTTTSVSRTIQKILKKNN